MNRARNALVDNFSRWPPQEGGIVITGLNGPEDSAFTQEVARHQEYFDDPLDTTLHMRGIRYTSMLLGAFDLPRRFIEFGAGISLPLTVGLKERIIDQALAVELNPNATALGQQIARKFRVLKPEKYRVITGDIMDDSFLTDTYQYRPMAIVANLPYLPEDREYSDSTKDGGSSGSDFINQQLKIAQRSGAPIVSTNFSSLSSPSDLLPLFERYDYIPHKAYIYVAPFGERSSHLYNKGIIDKDKGHEFHVQGDNLTQLMINLISVRRDIPAPRIDTTESLDMIKYFSASSQLVTV
jgi:hypothetical protein